ncbi:hypothetical protein AB836_01280 [Rickettsiales bacterium (ex Bugula neritina AB1)]|nr:hypothetical protein AB836_01280 [Rickettsiales bacterium (ex Bugula neritina AB1)]
MNEDVVLIVEINDLYIKSILLQKNWWQNYKVYNSYKIESLLLVNNHINFEEFQQQLQKFIYHIEYDSGEKIIDVIVIINCLYVEFFNMTKSLLVNNFVKTSHINHLLMYVKKHTNDKNIVLFEETNYLCDNISVFKPIDIYTNNLVITKKYFKVPNLIFNNINNIFKKFLIDIKRIHINICIIIEYLLKFMDTFILINLDFYHIDVLLLEFGKIKEYYKINLGLNNLVRYITQKYQISFYKAYQLIKQVGLVYDKKRQDIYDININFVENIWSNSFDIIKHDIKYKYNIPIFINGGQLLQPIDYFLKLKTKLNINNLNTYLKCPPEFESLYIFQYLFNEKKI